MPAVTGQRASSERPRAMRAALLALALPAWLALAVSASADEVNHAVPPPARNTMKVARTNLETALTYEHRALIAARDGEDKRAYHDLFLSLIHI